MKYTLVAEIVLKRLQCGEELLEKLNYQKTLDYILLWCFDYPCVHDQGLQKHLKLDEY